MLNKRSFFILLTLLFSAAASAEEYKISFQGQDGLNRPPLLTIGFETAATSTNVTASSELQNKDYADHAVEYRFFVKGELYKTLIELRDPTIITPISINVPFTVAAPPFPVTVVATLLYPKRPFTTVGTAVVMDTASVKTFDCTITDESGNEPKVYVINSTTTRPLTDGGFGLDFNARESSTNDDIKVSGLFSFSGTTLSGPLTINGKSYAMSAENVDRQFTELSLTTSDGLLSLSCS